MKGGGGVIITANKINHARRIRFTSYIAALLAGGAEGGGELHSRYSDLQRAG